MMNLIRNHIIYTNLHNFHKAFSSYSSTVYLRALNLRYCDRKCCHLTATYTLLLSEKISFALRSSILQRKYHTIDRLEQREGSESCANSKGHLLQLNKATGCLYSTDILRQFENESNSEQQNQRLLLNIILPCFVSQPPKFWH